MGFFAVLRPADHPEGALVRQCHVNVWVLPSLLPGRRLLYVDVGLELEAGEQPVDAIEVLLPFMVDPGREQRGDYPAQDLVPVLTSPATAELVFGGPVALKRESSSTVLEIGDYPKPMRLTNVQTTAAKPTDGYFQRPDSNLYTVPLAETLQPGKSAYLRVRWRVMGAAPVWKWKRLYGGAQFDFRVSDVREANTAEGDDPLLRNRVLPMDRLNVFLIAPLKFELQNASPDLRYLRVLEGAVWRDYLKGAAYGRRERLLVYYWRSGGNPSGARTVGGGTRTRRYAGPVSDIPSANEVARQRRRPASRAAAGAVTVDAPFRVFANFDRAVAGVWWFQLVRLVVGLLLAYGVLLLIRHPGVLWPDHAKAIVTWIVGVSLLSLVGVAQLVRRLGSDRAKATRLFLRRLERRILNLRR